MDRRSFLKSALAAAGWAIVPTEVARVAAVPGTGVDLVHHACPAAWEFRSWHWEWAWAASMHTSVLCVRGTALRGNEEMVVEALLLKAEVARLGGEQVAVRAKMLEALRVLNSEQEALAA